MTISAKDLTFGIELETSVPRNLFNWQRPQSRQFSAIPYCPMKPLNIGRYHNGRQIPCLSRGWKGESDSSLRTRIAGHTSCEFVSPKLKGVAGLKNVMATVRRLKELGARVNKTCGVHVHVGFSSISNPNACGMDLIRTPEMKRLQTLTSHHEQAIYASTGTKKRESGRYAEPINQLGSAERHTEISTSRFQLLNVANIATGRRPAVEFRAFAGTLNEDKIAGYVRMCLALVERSLTDNRLTDWTPRSKREGGVWALKRLYYAVGWTKGRTDRTYGDLNGDGIPTIKDSKRIMLKMAKKYDDSTTTASSL